jgi:hypothetical protein
VDSRIDEIHPKSIEVLTKSRGTQYSLISFLPTLPFVAIVFLFFYCNTFFDAPNSGVRVSPILKSGIPHSALLDLSLPITKFYLKFGM